MAEKTMWDMLSATTVTADYVTTRYNLHPQVVLPEIGTKNQIVHTGDDGSDEVVSLDDDPVFYLTLQWPKGLSPSDAGTIFDLWYDVAKANGMARTWYLTHPKDGKDYTVRFNGPMTRGYAQGTFQLIDQISIKVKGRAPAA